MRKVLLAGLTALAATALQAQPTTNPVTDSGIDTGAYDTSWIASLPWGTVTTTAATPNDGTYNADNTIITGDDLAVVQAEINALSGSGGGVLYFPAGTYDFSDDLYLANGVILRGATPASGDCRGSFTGSPTRTYTLTYDPPTNFLFPVYIHNKADDMSWTGTKRTKFFNGIFVTNATTASNYGLVNIDINGAYISIGDRYLEPNTALSTADGFGNSIPKNAVSAKNILIFGNRLNNCQPLEVAVPQPDTITSGSLVVGQKYFIATPGTGADFTGVGAANNNRFTVFTATGTTPTWGTGMQLYTYPAFADAANPNKQNRWQVWPTRTRGKIDAVTGGNTLVANNLIADLHYKYYVLGSVPAASIVDYPAGMRLGNAHPNGARAKVDQFLANNGAEMNCRGGNAAQAKAYFGGALQVGQYYQIAAYTAGDDFTNVGAASNAANVGFYATGTTPAVWTTSTLNDYRDIYSKDIARFSDGYGIRLNHVLDYVTAHSAVQEPSKHRDGQGIINNWVFGTTRVGIMGSGNGLIVKGNVREDYQATKWELITEAGTALNTNNSATFENRGIDITGGHDVVIEDNYVRVQRGTFHTPYMTVDGEGVLLQESSSTQHPTNWTMRNNKVHSYIGLYRIRQADGILFEGNEGYNSAPLYTDGVVNGSIGHTGGTVAFKNNTAGALYAKFNVVPRDHAIFDLGGNTPAPTATLGGNGSPSNPGPYNVDATPEVTILYPSKGDTIVEGNTYTVQVKVSRHPQDAVAVAGVKLWDGVTDYAVNGQMAGGYWTFAGGVGTPAGISLTLTSPDPVTGAIGGGIYTGSWTAPTGFNSKGLLVAEARLSPQTTVAANDWTEKSWGFRAPITPVGVAVAVASPNVSLTFPSVVGQKYRLEYSDSVGTTVAPNGGDNEGGLQTWIPVGTPIAGTGGNLVLSDPSAPGAGVGRFYRVAVTD